MPDQDERGYWMDTDGNLTPVPEAPYGWVGIPTDTPPGTEYVEIGCRWSPAQGRWVDHYVRPATKEEAEGGWRTIARP
jgi:hypothetical protein